MHIRKATEESSLSRAFANKQEKCVKNFSVNFKFKIGQGRELSLRYLVQRCYKPFI